MAPSRNALIGVALIVLLYVFPFLVGESYLFISIDFLIMALFAMSYNLLLGQAGMLSFGHAAYYGMGAYTVAVLFAKLQVPIYFGLIVAPLVAGAVALVVGWFSVRVTGMYFAMLTLAFAQLLHTIVMGWYSFTGGDDGLPVMPPDWLLSARNYYLFVLTVTIACIAVLSGDITVAVWCSTSGHPREPPARGFHRVGRAQLRTGRFRHCWRPSPAWPAPCVRRCSRWHFLP